MQRDRMMFLLVGLVVRGSAERAGSNGALSPFSFFFPQGNTVVALTRGGAKYVGILSSTSTPETGTEGLGVVLSCAQQILKEDSVGPVKRTLVIKDGELDGLYAHEVGLDVPVSMGRNEHAAGS